MKELLTIYNAIQWYALPSEKQYDDNRIKEYDDAAKLLTDREGLANFLLEQIGRNPGKTLEIAAGTGLVSQVLKNRIQDLHLVDISKAAINILKERVGDKPSIIQTDFFNLPFLSKTFDTFICVGGYRYVRQNRREEFWQEVRRVMKPGGRVIITQFYPRGVSIHGNDINVDKAIINSNLSLKSVVNYNAKIDIKGLRIKTGEYLSFEFAYNKNTNK